MGASLIVYKLVRFRLPFTVVIQLSTKIGGIPISTEAPILVSIGSPNPTPNFSYVGTAPMTSQSLRPFSRARGAHKYLNGDSGAQRFTVFGGVV